MDHTAAPGWLIEHVRKLQQYVGPHTVAGKFLGAIDCIIVYTLTRLRLIGEAPVKHLMQFSISLVVSVLGIVPGVLNMYGRSHEADIVTVSAGCVAALLAIIQFFPVDEWIHPSNSE